MGPGGSDQEETPAQITVQQYLELQQRYIKQLEDNARSGVITSESLSNNGRTEDFKPPPFTSNGTSSLQSKSLRTQFPDIKTSLLLEVMRHHVDPDELHKLSSHFRPPLDPKSKSSASPSKFKTPLDLVLPLLTYFQVLGAFAATRKDATNVLEVMRGGMMYIAHILDLSTRFQWSAVVRYHHRFHEARLAEMEEGNYSGWAETDLRLMSEVLIGWEMRKSDRESGRSSEASSSSRAGRSSKSQQYCFGFNGGSCTSTPCPDGRMHKCRKCDATDHGDKVCTKA